MTKTNIKGFEERKDTVADGDLSFQFCPVNFMPRDFAVFILESFSITNEKLWK